MNYLTESGFLVGQSENPIEYIANMRYWLVDDNAYSDSDGTQYVVLVNPETPPVPRPKVVEVPSEVTPRQARLALALTSATDEQYPNLLKQLEDTFASLPEPQKTIASITWEYSIAVERNNPLIAQMQQMIGFTNEQIDQLFIQAANL